MDELADRVGVGRVEIRPRNGCARVTPTTGQVIDSAAPVAELLQVVADMPLPPERHEGAAPDLLSMPGGVSNTTHGEGVVVASATP